jgi:hypothetical protein
VRYPHTGKASHRREIPEGGSIPFPIRVRHKDVKVTSIISGYAEVVSREISFKPRSHWEREIQDPWMAHLAKNCNITMPMGLVDHRSAAKVFMEPDYTIADLKRIARAIVHFEGVLNEYFSSFREDGRRHGRLSNHADNAAFKGKDRTQITSMMDNADESRGITMAFWKSMFPVPPGSKGYWWSYIQTSQGGCIEMAKPAAWWSWEHATKWAGGTISFVQATLACPSLQALRQ